MTPIFDLRSSLKSIPIHIILHKNIPYSYNVLENHLNVLSMLHNAHWLQAANIEWLADIIPKVILKVH